IPTTFAEVCIKPEIEDSLRMAVSYPILYPEVYTTGILARESTSGVLLFGPPGTGKTMTCRALAKQCGARMLQLHSSTVKSRYVGDIEKTISAAFRLARRLGPCVIFIDELDALFSKRRDGDNQWERGLTTEFTQEMDGLSTADANRVAGVIVVGATNRPQDIDSAVLRRFSRRILVDLPTLPQRKEIIQQYLSGEAFDETVDISKLAARTPLFSGSDLRHLVHSAALAALKEVVPTSWPIHHDAAGVPIPQPPPTPLESRCIQKRHFDQALKQVSASGASNRKILTS
ncbi:P-loop containing nucleoside triphosphate hydrolase protein, partial [Mycena olivaceomarginata]